MPDVLERHLRRAAFEAQCEERLRPGAMIDLHPAERVRRREVDDFDDRFVLMCVALEGQLVACALPGHPVARRGFDGDAARQPLGHSEWVRNEREDFVDWSWYVCRIGKRD